MYKLTFILCLLLVLAACEQQEVVTQKPADVEANFVILALGDSLTEGLGVAQSDNYPAQLQELLPKNIKVINAGLSGETSAGLLHRLDWVLKQKPDLTLLNIGANDGMRALPIKLTTNNIDAIITKIKQNNSAVIIIGMQIYTNLGKQYVNDFQDIYPNLANKHNIPLIPFFLEHIAGKAKYNQADLIHPNAQGYKVIVEKNIYPQVKQYLDSL
ncbi:MAG: arylesterase [Proteobacteria bacterium]|nr:arylesterase [Pseudomonadota bacterium]